ncbi:2-C-methyl-D-erythritol 4-phosphate cytidylyltransferase [Marivita sp. S2033]|uniref:2-C-methyl-D-erythritol 4-phosphate cytidylyltransferase n=1 Tax=Marivita sp. S2033 TaxID=3373187 RepID=UPI0039824A07
MTNAALIVAAGRGRRMAQSTPKQYLMLAGQPVVRHTLEAFLAAPDIHLVRVVIHPDDKDLYDIAVNGLTDPRLHEPVLGGATRSASVGLGLAALENANPATVLIHDAARPFCSPRLIGDVIASAEQADGAFAAIPVVDALWRTAEGCAVSPVSREDVWRAQTPQAFDFRKILDAHRNPQEDAADDVEIALRAGLRVKVVHGDERNFKITQPQDFERAERLIAALGRR